MGGLSPYDLETTLSTQGRGGLLFYQTFSREAVTDQGPSKPEYRLLPNELLRLFRGLLVRVYREEGKLGDVTRGFRDLTQLVAECPE